MAPARKIREEPIAPLSRTLIIDNGAYSLKAGFAGNDSCSIIPNCLARDGSSKSKVYVGSEISHCNDFRLMKFRRPMEKGYIVNWESEKEIWEREFFDKKADLHCDPTETRLVLTEAPNALPALQTICDQMVFEEFGFASYLRVLGPVLNAFNDLGPIFREKGWTARAADAPVTAAEVMLVVDSGYSHTTITPMLNGQPLQAAIRRLDVGGKQLTNYLARVVSKRQFDMTGEPYIMNQVKEAACYVSHDFKSHLEKSWKGTIGGRRREYTTAGGIAKDYTLPDYDTIMEGTLNDHDPSAGKLRGDDIMTLRNERFTVPEILFNPMDIGLRQPGLGALLMQSLSVLPTGLWPGLLANILVVGGSAKLPGFVQRLQAEVEALAPDECYVKVAIPTAFDPIVAAWHGGNCLAKSEPLVTNSSVTKQEYEEYGSAWVARTFSYGVT